MTEKERELAQDMLILIDTIKNKTDSLSANNRIPDLQLEIILSKIEQLHQKAIGLKYLNQHADEVSSSLYAGQQEVDQQISAPETQESIGQHAPVQKDVVINMDPTIEKPQIIEQKDIKIEKITNDLSAIGASAEDIGEKLQLQPLSDIKSAIGINDKFLFINELFGGSSDEFEAMVGLLNQLSSMEEAQQSLEKYGWEKENETAQSFIKLVSRRYL